MRPSSSSAASRSSRGGDHGLDRRLLAGAGRLERVEALPQRAVLGDAAELVRVQRRPALDQPAGERAGLPRELAVGVRVQAADLGQPGVVVREQVLAVVLGRRVTLAGAGSGVRRAWSRRAEAALLTEAIASTRSTWTRSRRCGGRLPRRQLRDPLVVDRRCRADVDGAVRRSGQAPGSARAAPSWRAERRTSHRRPPAGGQARRSVMSGGAAAGGAEVDQQLEVVTELHGVDDCLRSSVTGAGCDAVGRRGCGARTTRHPGPA